MSNILQQNQLGWGTSYKSKNQTIYNDWKNRIDLDLNPNNDNANDNARAYWLDYQEHPNRAAFLFTYKQKAKILATANLKNTSEREAFFKHLEKDQKFLDHLFSENLHHQLTDLLKNSKDFSIADAFMRQCPTTIQIWLAEQSSSFISCMKENNSLIHALWNSPYPKQMTPSIISELAPIMAKTLSPHRFNIWWKRLGASAVNFVKHIKEQVLNLPPSDNHVLADVLAEDRIRGKIYFSTESEFKKIADLIENNHVTGLAAKGIANDSHLWPKIIENYMEIHIEEKHPYYFSKIKNIALIDMILKRDYAQSSYSNINQQTMNEHLRKRIWEKNQNKLTNKEKKLIVVDEIHDQNAPLYLQNSNKFWEKFSDFDEYLSQDDTLIKQILIEATTEQLQTLIKLPHSDAIKKSIIHHGYLAKLYSNEIEVLPDDFTQWVLDANERLLSPEEKSHALAFICARSTEMSQKHDLVRRYPQHANAIYGTSNAIQPWLMTPHGQAIALSLPKDISIARHVNTLRNKFGHHDFDRALFHAVLYLATQIDLAEGNQKSLLQNQLQKMLNYNPSFVFGRTVKKRINDYFNNQMLELKELSLAGNGISELDADFQRSIETLIISPTLRNSFAFTHEQLRIILAKIPNLNPLAYKAIFGDEKLSLELAKINIDHKDEYIQVGQASPYSDNPGMNAYLAKASQTNQNAKTTLLAQIILNRDDFSKGIAATFNENATFKQVADIIRPTFQKQIDTLLEYDTQLRRLVIDNCRISDYDAIRNYKKLVPYVFSKEKLEAFIRKNENHQTLISILLSCYSASVDNKPYYRAMLIQIIDTILELQNGPEQIVQIIEDNLTLKEALTPEGCATFFLKPEVIYFLLQQYNREKPLILDINRLVESLIRIPNDQREKFNSLFKDDVFLLFNNDHLQSLALHFSNVKNYFLAHISSHDVCQLVKQPKWQTIIFPPSDPGDKLTSLQQQLLDDGLPQCELLLQSLGGINLIIEEDRASLKRFVRDMLSKYPAFLDTLLANPLTPAVRAFLINSLDHPKLKAQFTQSRFKAFFLQNTEENDSLIEKFDNQYFRSLFATDNDDFSINQPLILSRLLKDNSPEGIIWKNTLTDSASLMKILFLKASDNSMVKNALHEAACNPDYSFAFNLLNSQHFSADMAPTLDLAIKAILAAPDSCNVTLIDPQYQNVLRLLATHRDYANDFTNSCEIHSNLMMHFISFEMCTNKFIQEHVETIAKMITMLAKQEASRLRYDLVLKKLLGSGEDKIFRAIMSNATIKEKIPENHPYTNPQQAIIKEMQLKINSIEGIFAAIATAETDAEAKSTLLTNCSPILLNEAHHYLMKAPTTAFHFRLLRQKDTILKIISDSLPAQNKSSSKRNRLSNANSSQSRVFSNQSTPMKNHTKNSVDTDNEDKIECTKIVKKTNQYNNLMAEMLLEAKKFEEQIDPPLTKNTKSKLNAIKNLLAGNNFDKEFLNYMNKLDDSKKITSNPKSNPYKTNMELTRSLIIRDRIRALFVMRIQLDSKIIANGNMEGSLTKLLSNTQKADYTKEFKRAQLTNTSPQSIISKAIDDGIILSNPSLCEKLEATDLDTYKQQRIHNKKSPLPLKIRNELTKIFSSESGLNFLAECRIEEHNRRSIKNKQTPVPAAHTFIQQLLNNISALKTQAQTYKEKGLLLSAIYYLQRVEQSSIFLQETISDNKALGDLHRQYLETHVNLLDLYVTTTEKVSKEHEKTRVEAMQKTLQYLFIEHNDLNVDYLTKLPDYLYNDTVNQFIIDTLDTVSETPDKIKHYLNKLSNNYVNLSEKSKQHLEILRINVILKEIQQATSLIKQAKDSGQDIKITQVYQSTIDFLLLSLTASPSFLQNLLIRTNNDIYLPAAVILATQENELLAQFLREPALSGRWVQNDSDKRTLLTASQQGLHQELINQSLSLYTHLYMGAETERLIQKQAYKADPNNTFIDAANPLNSPLNSVGRETNGIPLPLPISETNNIPLLPPISETNNIPLPPTPPSIPLPPNQTSPEGNVSPNTNGITASALANVTLKPRPPSNKTNNTNNLLLFDIRARRELKTKEVIVPGFQGNELKELVKTNIHDIMKLNEVLIAVRDYMDDTYEITPKNKTVSIFSDALDRKFNRANPDDKSEAKKLKSNEAEKLRLIKSFLDQRKSSVQLESFFTTLEDAKKKYKAEKATAANSPKPK